jgi:response regulator RpfG family c-di-GMP phosphodiesterase
MHSLLFVDDESGLLEIFRDFFVRGGYDVRTAGNGRQALELLEQRPADLIVSDLRMPVMGGRELLDEIVRRGLDSAVIILTAYGTIDNAVECLKTGAADYHLKPFDIEELAEKVETVLARRAERLSRGVCDLETMRELSRTMNIAPKGDFTAVCEAVAAFLTKTFQAERTLLLFDEHTDNGRNGGPLNCHHHTRTAAAADSRIDRLLGVLSRVNLRLGRPRLMDPKAFPPDMRHGLPKRLVRSSIMFAPMPPIADAHVAGASGCGVVCIMRTEEMPAYSKHDLELLSVLATHASATLGSRRASQALADTNLGVVQSYVRAVEAKDVYTRGHSERVSRYAVLLGERLGLGESELELLRISGLLHDIGKIGISDSLLNKPSRLEPDEFELMKAHPGVGRDIIGAVPSLGHILPIVYHHHEWMGGCGYPDGLSGEEIPLLARIVSVVDGYEAITSDRAYHKASPPDVALAILDRGAGLQWDPRIVTAWRSVCKSSLAL